MPPEGLHHIDTQYFVVPRLGEEFVNGPVIDRARHRIEIG